MDLAENAERYLRSYCDPTSRYAWPAYDLDANPGRLVPTDLLSPALLSYPIRGKYLQQMLQEPAPGEGRNPYAELVHRLQVAATDAAARHLAFHEIDPDRLNDRSLAGWGLVLVAVDATRHCSGLSSVAVTKILHRKLPDLVPIRDSRLERFYGATGPTDLFGRIHRDLHRHGDLLDLLRAPYRLPDGRQQSRLRALDIVFWMSFEPADAWERR
ncbi:MAG: DUF6308 family protein [Acidimicrobiia bacterium]